MLVVLGVKEEDVQIIIHHMLLVRAIAHTVPIFNRVPRASQYSDIFSVDIYYLHGYPLVVVVRHGDPPVPQHAHAGGSLQLARGPGDSHSGDVDSDNHLLEHLPAPHPPPRHELARAAEHLHTEVL